MQKKLELKNPMNAIILCLKSLIPQHSKVLKCLATYIYVINVSRVAKNMHQLRHCTVVLWSSHQAKPEPRPTELVLPGDLIAHNVRFSDIHSD